MNITPIDVLDKTFGHVKLHQHIGEIIQTQSTNPVPLGSIVYKGIAFPNKIKVADIGCGYGRCINYLKDIIPKNSEYIGIDPLESNRATFLNTTANADFNGKFLCGSAETISEFPDNYFDLILCNYSLYFFIDTLALIVQKLKPNGLFITITHSNKSLVELLDDLQIVLNIDHKLTWNELGSEQVLDNFNSENGSELLEPFFNNIEIIEYPNAIEFHRNDIDNLFDLLQFKKTSLIHHNNYTEYIKTKEFDVKLKETVTAKIDLLGKYVLTKNDTVFRCVTPKNK